MRRLGTSLVVAVLLAPQRQRFHHLSQLLHTYISVRVLSVAGFRSHWLLLCLFVNSKKSAVLRFCGCLDYYHLRVAVAFHHSSLLHPVEDKAVGLDKYHF